MNECEAAVMAMNVMRYSAMGIAGAILLLCVIAFIIRKPARG